MKLLKITPRLFECTACGYQKTITTNHEGSCIGYCKSCSWKAYYAPSYPISGHLHGRLFKFTKIEASEAPLFE